MNFSDLNYAVYSAGSQRLEIVQPWSLSLSILPLRWEGGMSTSSMSVCIRCIVGLAPQLNE